MSLTEQTTGSDSSIWLFEIENTAGSSAQFAQLLKRRELDQLDNTKECDNERLAACEPMIQFFQSIEKQ